MTSYQVLVPGAHLSFENHKIKIVNKHYDKNWKILKIDIYMLLSTFQKELSQHGDFSVKLILKLYICVKN